MPSAWIRLYLFREDLSPTHPQYLNMKKAKLQNNGKPVYEKLMMWIGGQVVRPEGHCDMGPVWHPHGYHGTPFVTAIMLLQSGGHFRQIGTEGARNRLRTADKKRLHPDDSYFSHFTRANRYTLRQRIADFEIPLICIAAVKAEKIIKPKRDTTKGTVLIGTKARPVVWLFRGDTGTETLSDKDKYMGDWKDPWKEIREEQRQGKARAARARNCLFPSSPWAEV